MTISRMQEPRQLYGLGSLVKKITKPIKKIVKSPIGKAALLGAAAYGLGGAKFLGGEGIFASGQGMSRFGNLLNLIKSKQTGGLGIFDKLSGGQKAFLGAGAAASLLPFFMKGQEEEEIVEDPFSVTPSSIADIRQMARNRDPSLAFLPQEQFVRPGFFSPFAAAEGGVARLGYDEGANEKINMIKDMLSRGADNDTIMSITGASQAEIDQVKNSMAEGGRAKLAGGGNRLSSLINLMRNAMDRGDMDAAETFRSDIFKEFGLRMNKGGIASLPKVRMLEGGVPEIDYRQSGGFVPMGKKEKADDVPAMLSKNEFVMTADAVRGMGDGNVEKGAQKMYDQMRELESRVV